MIAKNIVDKKPKWGNECERYIFRIMLIVYSYINSI
ncbi:hypothetical protein V438_05685 [Clostridioides difficile]|nr:hypothetical protein V439_11020 [Clostridioides difficile]PCN58027.1 hypothetical protein V438_05685 [Clostridioides difficile]